LSKFWVGTALFAAVLGLLAPAHGADFEIGPAGGGSSPAATSPAVPGSGTGSSEVPGLPAADVPAWIDAGDVPTAYTLQRYEVRTDFRLYEGGGILGKAYLGLFPRFFIGGAADARDFVGSGPVQMNRDDAEVLARFELLKEDEDLPAVSIGWDGPSYDSVAERGLYLSASKEIPTAVGFVQFHGGVNSAQVGSFVASRDLRASAAVTTAIYNYGIFTNLDDALDPLGARWNAGLEGHFAPITLGLEFRDLASARADTPVSRLLRVTWIGRF